MISWIRWLAVALVPFLLVAAVLLLGFPDRTETLFAWTIDPPATAMLLGCAYVGGIWFFGRVAVARHWSSVVAGFPAVVVFASLLAVATVVHLDRFHAGTLIFTVWAALYATTPFLAAGAWWAGSRAVGTSGLRPRPAASAQLVSAPWCTAMLVVGLSSAAAGTALFVGVPWASDAWAWPLTPLTTKVVGSVLTLPGAVALGLLVDRRWASFRVLVQAQLVSLACILVTLVVVRDQLARGGAAGVALSVGLAGASALYVVFYVTHERVRGRASAELDVGRRA